MLHTILTKSSHPLGDCPSFSSFDCQSSMCLLALILPEIEIIATILLPHFSIEIIPFLSDYLYGGFWKK